MKKIILLSFLLPLFALSSTAQEKRVKSKVVSATVYTQGAQITRVAKVYLDKGENRVVLTNLPPSLDESSMQVSCGDATIVSVTNQKNMLDSLTQSQEFQKLQGKKKELEKRIKVEQALLQTTDTEKDVLLSNKKLVGEQGVKLEDLKNSLIYFRTRLEELEKSKVDKEELIENLNNDLQKINDQLLALSTEKVKNTSEVVVVFSANQPVDAGIKLKYFTLNAAWYPTYDVRVNNINDPLAITCKANVYQTTGEDWNKVKLSVSSGNPTSGSTAPTIEPWFIDIVQPYYKRGFLQGKAAGVQKEKMQVEAYDMIAESKTVDDVKYEMPVTVSESQTNFTFNIDIPYDIPSKQQPTIAILQAPTLKATYQYSSVPKLSENAYLVANITDWQALNLLNGDANLYFESNYVGSTYLDTKAFNDTLKLSLGKDESIAIKRTKVKSFTEKNLVGSKITETRVWEITITNGKKQDVEIDLKDQIPVSSNEKVKVKLVDQSGSDYTAATGILKWTVKLKPTETKKIQFSYSVEYPKGSQVYLE